MPYLASPVETLGTLRANYTLHGETAAAAGHSGPGVVPVMRTVFVSESAATCRAVKNSLTNEAKHRMRDPSANTDDWTIVGDQAYVRDTFAQYQGEIGMTHLVARGRIGGVSDQDQMRSLELMRVIADDT